MVSLAYPDLLTTTVTGPDPVPVSPIQPAAWPKYIQPISVPMLPAPVSAPPPPDQFRGEGGTAFGSKPLIYIQAIVPDGLILNGGEYQPPARDYLNNPVSSAPETKPRPGDSTIQPVPMGQVPTKPNVAPTVPQVTVPKPSGPVQGQFLGLELGLVPLWAWLVGAALLGARILR